MTNPTLKDDFETVRKALGNWYADKIMDKEKAFAALSRIEESTDAPAKEDIISWFNRWLENKVGPRDVAIINGVLHCVKYSKACKNLSAIAAIGEKG